MLSRGQGSGTSVARATPSFPAPCKTIPPAPLIEEGLLCSFDGSNVIGKGCFGSCTKMVYKNLFIVCSKKINDSVSLAAMKSEAAILYARSTLLIVLDSVHLFNRLS